MDKFAFQHMSELAIVFRVDLKSMVLSFGYKWAVWKLNKIYTQISLCQFRIVRLVIQNNKQCKMYFVVHFIVSTSNFLKTCENGISNALNNIFVFIWNCHCSLFAQCIDIRQNKGTRLTIWIKKCIIYGVFAWIRKHSQTWIQYFTQIRSMCIFFNAFAQNICP